MMKLQKQKSLGSYVFSFGSCWIFFILTLASYILLFDYLSCFLQISPIIWLILAYSSCRHQRGNIMYYIVVAVRQLGRMMICIEYVGHCGLVAVVGGWRMTGRGGHYHPWMLADTLQFYSVPGTHLQASLNRWRIIIYYLLFQIHFVINIL